MLNKIISKSKLLSVFIPCQGNNYRPKFLASQFLFYYFIFLLVLKIGAISLLVYFPDSVFFADITKISLINLVNDERAGLNLPPLKENSTLNQAAYLKAQDIIEKDYFSHNSPEGITPWYWFKKSGYDYAFAGENLAIGFLDSEEVHNGWMGSSSHRSNLLNPKYDEIGVAVMKGDFEGKETTVVVQLFGTPQLKKEKISEPISEPIEEISDKAPEPVVDTEEPESPEKIVSGTQDKTFEGATEKDLNFKFFSFIFSGYFGLTQKIIYASLIVVIIALMINISVKLNIQHKDLIFNAVFFLILLVLFIILDKNTVIQIIPHNFNIH